MIMYLDSVRLKSIRISKFCVKNERFHLCTFGRPMARVYILASYLNFSFIFTTGDHDRVGVWR